MPSENRGYGCNLKISAQFYSSTDADVLKNADISCIPKTKRVKVALEDMMYKFKLFLCSHICFLSKTVLVLI